MLSTGFMLPEGFLYLNEKGYIQDRNNIPVIYHYAKRNNNKKLKYRKGIDCNDDRIAWRYDRSISNEEKLKAKKNKARYWWILKNQRM